MICNDWRMTAFSVRGDSKRGPVVVSVDGHNIVVADEQTEGIVWQRSGPGIELNLVDDVLDVGGAMHITIHRDQVNRATQLITRYRNAAPAPIATESTESTNSSGVGSGAKLKPPQLYAGPAAPPRAATAVPGPSASPAALRPGTPSPLMDSMCDRVRVAAGVVQFLAIALGVIGLVGGLVLAFQTEDVGDGFLTETERPYVAEGIALIFAALVQGAVLYLLGEWGAAWAAKNRPSR
jgi:hypothetical protein